MTKKVLGAVLWGILGLSLGTAWAGSTAVLEIGNTISTGRTITVCTGATATESGTMLLNALSAITDASAAKPYLIKIEPGIYDVGSNNVQMKEYVDLEGSGEMTTKITGNISISGVVYGANNAEIRFLTVENTGGGTYARAIFNSSASPKITNVTAIGLEATTNSYGVHNYNSSHPKMTNVTAIASGGKSFNIAVSNSTSSSPVMTNVTATASGGMSCRGISNSESSSPKMTNVTAVAEGGESSSIGVDNHTSCSPVMINVTATASGGTTYNWGVLNHTSSSPTMTNVTATASGGNWSNGINNLDSSSPTLVSVTATASGGFEGNIGMINHGTSCTVTADRCTFEATGTNTKSIYNDTESTIFIGASKLSGPRQGSGTYHCVNCYDGSYSTLNSNCQ